MKKVPVSYPTLLIRALTVPAINHVLGDIARFLVLAADAINNPDYGPTTERPTQDLVTGQSFFDTTLGKPIWWKGSTNQWVDGTGTPV